MQEVDTNSSSPHPPEVWDPANPATWIESRGGGDENNNTDDKTNDERDNDENMLVKIEKCL